MTKDVATMEDEVRAMLQRRAADPEPAPPAWEELVAGGPVRRLDGQRRGSSWSRTAPRTLVAVAAAVALVVAAASVLVARDDTARTVVADDPGTATTAVTSASPAPATFPRAIWPATTDGELAAHQRAFDDGDRRELGAPLTAAQAYLRDRLGADATTKTNEFLEGDVNSGEVTYVVSTPGGPVDGRVLVRRAGEGSIWTVVASHVELLAPTVEYDGTRVTGSVAAEMRGGEVTIRIAAVDGSDPVSEEPVRLAAGERHTIDEVFRGKPGVVVRFTLVGADGSVALSEVRADAGSGGAGSPASGRATCSTSDMRQRDVAQPDMPPVVATMRRNILDAARACDYDRLQALALAGDQPGFTYSYGDGGSPAAYWREREAEGEPVLRRLVQTLELRPILQRPEPDAGPGPEEQWVWPAVSGTSTPSDRDWDDLRPVYGDREVDEAKAMGSWYGYRAGITVDGDWIYFVAGD